MTVGQESAYTEDMSWKDFMTDDEQAELDKAEAEKQAAVDGYNSVWRKLKIRCDARMRRFKESTKCSINSKED